MHSEDKIIIRGLRQNNLKNVSLDIPKGKIVVFTGVSGSGKSSLIRDVFAKQYADRVVLVDQSPVTATGRSTPASFLGFFDEIRKVMAADNGVEPALFSFNSKEGSCSAQTALISRSARPCSTIRRKLLPCTTTALCSPRKW
ncbi:MAG: ATP-binding cassette domain-containing protein [Angelakisella sp.]|nr:ATP-binding cassette domain-containing protein [Angelakisella sp.]